jgi:hypothetical protein
MDLAGGVVMDAGGGGGSGRLLKHGRGNAARGENHGWVGGRAKQARTASVGSGDAVEAAAAPFLLGSCGGPGHGGERMLSFSSAAASSRASAAPDHGGAMPPLYYGTPASCSGEHGDRPAGGCRGGAGAKLPFFADWILVIEKLVIHFFSSIDSNHLATSLSLRLDW